MIPQYCCRTYFEPYDLASMPWSVSWRELMRILQRSSLAILDCLIREMAVTSVSMAPAYSPAGESGYSMTRHYSLPHKISTQFCCVLFCCGCTVNSNLIHRTYSLLSYKAASLELGRDRCVNVFLFAQLSKFCIFKTGYK